MRRLGQGEALATWTVWGASALVVLVTYSRVDPDDLYHTSREGLEGGLGRSLVLLNFPIALVAIALALVAVDVLPRLAWLAAGPAIALSAVVAWPGVVDQDDLDARWVNSIPALGVLIALALTAEATRRHGASFARRRSGDLLRVAIAAALVVLSLPWLAAELGYHLAGDVFLGEEPHREGDGSVIAAVHLGHHHGLDGTLLVITALFVSRFRTEGRRLRVVLAAYLGTMFAYGAVNFAQDIWLEQVVKRGWTETSIPGALEPGPRPIWLVIFALAGLATFVLMRENERAEPAPAPSYSPQ